MTPVDTTVNLIYKLNNEPYYASLKGELNPNGENYYLIDKGRIIKQRIPIYFFR